MADRLYPLDEPMYNAAMAGRVVGISATRVRRWLRGYEYRYSVASEAKRRKAAQGPVVHRTTDSAYASFLDLIDLLFVRHFLDYGIPLQRLRKALSEAEELIGGHHFAQRSFFTDGHEVWVQVKDESESLMQLLSGGQWVIAPIIRQLAEQIDFQAVTGFAERWYPAGFDGRVVLDPRVSFGSPTVANRGVETCNIYDLFVAEGKRVVPVSRWMELREEEVEAAVAFEQQLRAA